MDILKRVESAFDAHLSRVLAPTDFEEIDFNYKALKADERLLTAGIVCVTFVVNKRDRYYVFVRKDGMEVLYTRPKEGYLPALLNQLAYNDFTFNDIGNLHTRGNVCGKLCDIHLNRKAAKALNSHFTFYAEKAKVEEYSFGFKITLCDYYKFNFNLDFELVIKQINGEFVKYIGNFIQGKFNAIVNEKTRIPCTMIEAFNRAIL